MQNILINHLKVRIVNSLDSMIGLYALVAVIALVALTASLLADWYTRTAPGTAYTTTEQATVTRVRLQQRR